MEFKETKILIDIVLSASPKAVEELLILNVKLLNRTIQQFYDGVIRHGPSMDYTSDQWFDFHSKAPHWRLRDEKTLMDKLTPRQRENL